MKANKQRCGVLKQLLTLLLRPLLPLLPPMERRALLATGINPESPRQPLHLGLLGVG